MTERNDIVALLARIEERQTSMKVQLDEMDDRIKTIEDMAMRYRGATIAVLAIGGFLGWASSNWEWFKSIFR